MQPFSTRFLLAAITLGALLGFTPAADKDEGWVSLFNGKNLEGWVQRGGQAKYSVED